MSPLRVWRRLKLRLSFGLRQQALRFEPRLTAIERRLSREPVQLVKQELPDGEDGPRLLLSVSNPDKAAHLARMAAAVAATRGATVVVLYVDRDGSEKRPRQVPEASAWPALPIALKAIRDQGVPAGYMVLRANNIGVAIRRACQRLRADIIVLGWRGDPMDVRPEQRRLAPPLRAVLEYPPADVMVVGGLGEHIPSKILVPMVHGRDSELALNLARGLAAETQHVTALKVLPSGARLSEVERSAERLREDLELYGAGGMGQLVLRSEARASGILTCIERGYDGVIMAAPQEPLLERLLFGKVQMAVASASDVPVVVVKGRSPGFVYLGRRLWRLAYDRLPKLSEDERVEVEESIRVAASPRVDFFIMTGLSSTIAGFGLLLNSPAVIIGAMLVAPLMAAIIGIGLGVVEGDLGLIRRAGSAAVRGALLAILVGAALGLLRAGMDPVPSEILSRTRPNLLDLGVALASGAAGAYAISRKGVSASLAGVAIAAALVPPLVSAGIGLPLRRLDIFLGALLLYMTNFVAIAAAGGIMMLLLGFGPAVEEEEEISVLRRGMQTALALLAVVAISLGFLTWQTVRLAGSEQVKQQVEQVVRREMDARTYAEFEGLDEIEVPSEQGSPIHVELTLKMPAAVVADYEYETARDLRNAISAEIGRPVELTLSVIPTRRILPQSQPPTAMPSQAP